MILLNLYTVNQGSNLAAKFTS